ncbi:MAG: Mur ligase family protein [Patescibacteria group bacterium]|jgi:UDP-N-acetylmuramyl pentapeptide synthase
MKNVFLKFIYFTLAAYARKVIATHKPFVIGITGSVGKSTTKEMVAQTLRDHFGDQVRANFGNLNAEIGIPLTILGYDKLPSKLLWPFFLVQAYFRTFEKKYPRYLVLEMGVERPGDIQYFGTIVRPDIGIITSTAPAHIANFPSREVQQAEKREMANIIKKDGSLLINADDSGLAKIDFPGIATVGIQTQTAQFRANSIKVSESGTEYRVETLGQKISIKSRLLGEHFVYAALFAFAVGNRFGIQSLEIKKSIEKTAPQPGRMNILRGRDGIIILDDTYNASPASIKAALDVLSNFSGRKVAIIGNMNELGEIEEQSHREVAAYAKGIADLAVFAGKNAKMMAEVCGNGALSYLTRKDLEADLANIVKSQDVVLIKASQNGNFFEEITKLLLFDKSKSAEILVRQSRFWLKKKGIK